MPLPPLGTNPLSGPVKELLLTVQPAIDCDIPKERDCEVSAATAANYGKNVSRCIACPWRGKPYDGRPGWYVDRVREINLCFLG